MSKRKKQETIPITQGHNRTAASLRLDPVRFVWIADQVATEFGDRFYQIADTPRSYGFLSSSRGRCSDRQDTSRALSTPSSREYLYRYDWQELKCSQNV